MYIQNKIKPTIIAVICTNGERDLLLRAINSILAQELRPHKLIICLDKDSKQEINLIDIFSQAKQELFSITVLQNKSHKSGLAGVANTVIEHLANDISICRDSTYLAFLDDDDYWSANYIFSNHALLNSGVSFTASIINRLQSDGTIIENQLPPCELKVEDFLIGGAAIQLSNLIISLETLLSVGGFDENLITNHDRDLCIRLCEGKYSYAANYETSITHDISHRYLRMSTPSNPLKQEGLRLFYKKWQPLMNEDILQKSLQRAAGVFNYRHKYIRPALLVATICLSKQGINNFISQFENVDFSNFDFDILIFANFPNSQNAVMEKPFGTVQVVSRTNESNRLSIAQARNVLHYEVLNLCNEKNLNPLVWLLDEDIRIESDSAITLAHCWAMKFSGRHDVLIGNIVGESPNSSLFGLRGDLTDLRDNLNLLNGLASNESLPCFKQKNKEHKIANSQYYYDLDLKSFQQLNEGNSTIWLEPDFVGETVVKARKRLLKSLPAVAEGKRFLRLIERDVSHSIWRNNELNFHRGPNCIILNLEALRIPNPEIQINDEHIRRSDMLWALNLSRQFNYNIVKASVTVRHVGDTTTEAFGLAKNKAELLGSIIFNAFKKTENINDFVEFASMVQNVASKRIAMVRDNLIAIKNLLTELSAYEDDAIKKFTSSIRQQIVWCDCDWLENIFSLLSNREILHSIYSQYNLSLTKRAVIEPIWNRIETDDGNFYLGGTDDPSIKLIKSVKATCLSQVKKPLVRIHSSCTHSEVFGAKDCDCESQLSHSKQLINQHGNGVIFYLDQEGRGHGFSTKLKIVNKMAEDKVDTYEACKILGLEKDKREYGKVMQLMRDVGLKKFFLLSNNSDKINSFPNDFDIVLRQIIGDFNVENHEYLYSKNAATHNNLYITASQLDELKYDAANKIEFYERTDEYVFFSNFARLAVFHNGTIWPTSEHAYQAQKFTDGKIKEMIRQQPCPTKAKSIARSHLSQVRSDWDKIKLPIMLSVLLHKTKQHSDIRNKLLASGNAEIIELCENDNFWGRNFAGKGHNYLGKLWMFIRQHYNGGE